MISPPTSWSMKLWDNILPHSHLHTLHDKVASGQQITIASNASMNAANNSCFAWIIATTQNKWTGTGPVPGPTKDNHTGRAEAYGVLTAFQFLCHYLNHYPTNYARAKPIKVFCDNRGILQRTQQLLPPNNLYPRDSIQDYYDLYSMIACIANTFHPIPVKLHHVKGHQDQQQQKNGNQNNQTPTPLSLEAQLNIQCDTTAAKALTTTYQHGKHTPIIPLPSAWPYLYVGKRLIVRKLQQTL